MILFGRYAGGEPARDIDVCLVLFQKKASKGFDKRIEHSGAENLDVSVSQDLPLYVRPSFLKDGIVLHCKNEDLLYDIAIKTAKEFELFRPNYELHLKCILYGAKIKQLSYFWNYTFTSRFRAEPSASIT